MSSDRRRRITPSNDSPAAAGTDQLVTRIGELEQSLQRYERHLRVREEVIRRLRSELLTARTAHERLVSSRTFRLAVKMRKIAVVMRPRAVHAALRKRRRD